MAACQIYPEMFQVPILDRFGPKTKHLLRPYKSYFDDFTIVFDFTYLLQQKQHF